MTLRFGKIMSRGIATTVVAVLTATLLQVPAQASAEITPRASATSAQVPSPRTIDGATSSDLALDGYGDESGYHLQIARGANDYQWQSLATIRPQNANVSSWTGYQCLTGDGRFAAVEILASSAVTVSAARAHGAFAYSIETATGKVTPLATGVGLKYFSPACGKDDVVAFTAGLGAEEQTTDVVVFDLAARKKIRQTTVTAQVTSPVLTQRGLIGVAGSSLVSLDGNGTAAHPATPKVLATVDGAPFNLRPSQRGGVDFLVAKPDSERGELMHYDGKSATTLGTGKLNQLSLTGTGRGPNTVVGLEGMPSNGQFNAVDAAKLPGMLDAVSLHGQAIFTVKTTPRGAVKAEQSADEAAKASAQERQVLKVTTGEVGDRTFDSAVVQTQTDVSDDVPDGVVSDRSSERNFSAPREKGRHSGNGVHRSPAPTTPPPSRAGVKPTSAPSGDQTSTATLASVLTPRTATAAGTPTCSIARLDPAMQVTQPSNAQVNWAVQMAEQGLLSGSQYSRPANFHNMGLAAYSPSDDFSPIPLTHPSGSSQTTVPRSVMLGILAQESNFNQASWHALPGVSADPLIADYYGSAGSIDQIDYPSADCGYGIAQVTNGMRAGDSSLSLHGQMKIANDYQENISAGLQILEDTWNQLYSAGIIANDGDPSKLENWYFALWAYNSGIQPTAAFGNSTGCTPGPSCTGPDGTWGVGWANNPRNPAFPPNRAPFLQNSYADAAHPADWPYQERVLGWMASPLIRYGYYGFSTPDYHGTSWIQFPGVNAMCDSSNSCNPTDATGKYCTLADYECWWHKPATWVTNCAVSCATSAYEYGAGSTEPGYADPHPPTCDLDTGTVPLSAIIVDDQPSPAKNVVGCSNSNWTSNGTFSLNYGKDASGAPVGQIDTHQLGVGLGGRMLFTHTQPSTDTAVINTGTWTPNLPSLQYYKVKVHFPATGATATDVVYTINPGGGVAPWKFRVNQDWGSEQWATLGTFAMQNGATVSLDNSSNMTAGVYDVAYDAIAFIPMGGTPGSPIGGPAGVQDEPKGSNPAFVNCGCVQRTAGDPVNTQTGYYGDNATDLSTPGLGIALNVSRSYASALADPSGPNKSLAVNGPFGWGWTYNYGLSATTDATTGKVTILQEDGSRVAFNLSGGVYSTTAPRFDATLVKNGTTYVYKRRGNTIFTFDTATGRLSSESDLAGSIASTPYATTFTYDGSGHLSTAKDPAGRTYAFTWTGAHITSVKDSANRQIDYGYDANGNLTDVYGVGTIRTGGTDDNSDRTQYGYTSAHLLNSWRTPANYGKTGTPAPVMSMVYDAKERVTSQTDAIGRTTTFVYGPDTATGLLQGQTQVTDPAGHKTIDTYDTNGLLTSETRGAGTADSGTWKYTYDPVSLGVTTAVDPGGHTTTYSYDDHGNRISSSDAAGNTTVYQYDNAGHQVLSISPTGLRTATTYSTAGVPTQVSVSETSAPLGNSTVSTTAAPGVRTIGYGYSDAAHPGLRTSTTDARGKVTTIGYDTYGDVISISDPLSHKTLMGYNTATGWLTSTVSPSGTSNGITTTCAPPAKGCTTYGHDAWGNTTIVTDPLGHQSKAAFDANGRKTSTTDANTHTTVITYDAAGQAISTKAPDNTVTSTAYTPTGKVASNMDGLKNKTSYGYDGQDRQITVTDADNHTTTTAYDPAGLTTKTITPKNVSASYSYDTSGRLASLSYSDGTPGISGVVYDQNNRKISATDGTGTSTWAFDEFGEITKHTNGAGSTIGYGYDQAGNLASESYPGWNGAVTRNYDDSERLSTVADMSGNTTTIGYTLDGQINKLAYPNGTAVINTLNDAGQLTAQALTKGATALASLSYTRDNAGQLTGQTPTGTPGQAETYAYTPNNQLGTVTTGGTPSANAYDAANNATTVRNGSQAFDPANQLCWSSTTTISSPSCATKPAGATAYAYDADGNRTSTTPTSGAASTYTYNGADELTKAVTAAGTTTYSYDGAGLRSTKSSGTTTTPFTWDGATTANLLEDGTNTWIYGPGGVPLEQLTAGPSPQTSFFFSDQIGSTRALTDGTGNLSGSYGYDAHGAITSHAGTATTPLQYVHGYLDSETGFTYFRARYYDPKTTQFLTRDPAYQKTLQWYAYAGNNPLNAVDPTGLDWWNDSTFWMNAGIVVASVAIDIGTAGLATPELAMLDGAIFAGEAVEAGAAITEVAEAGAAAGESAAAASESAASTGWKLGDDVYTKTAAGNDPAWSTVRSRFWKNEAADPEYGSWGADNLERMKCGKAPQRFNPDKGGMESMELSHEPIPFRDGGKSFVPRWPQDHAAVDPFRRPGY